jgi:hypothetical protein
MIHLLAEVYVFLLKRSCVFTGGALFRNEGPSYAAQICLALPGISTSKIKACINYNKIEYHCLSLYNTHCYNILNRDFDNGGNINFESANTRSGECI